MATQPLGPKTKRPKTKVTKLLLQKQPSKKTTKQLQIIHAQADH